jgi:uncharacterized protein YbjT (DUF2867 family)
MHIVLGATGHVGSALAKTLLDKGEPVTIVTHDAMRAADWINVGAQAAVVDVHDTEALREVFNRGEKLFLLNPPAAVSTDTIKEEKRTLASILKALENSSIKKVVGESSYGAQPGDGHGDLNVLYSMEQALKDQGLPNSIIRAAYYMSNWNQSLETAIDEGLIYSMYPVDFKIPMVCPEDLGHIAAQLMMESADSTRLVYVEGPERYSPNDVARSFSKALGKTVQAVSIPETNWMDFLKKQGFCEKAATSMIAMTKVALEEQYGVTTIQRGHMTLDQHIQDLVETGAADGKRAPKMTSLEETL